MSTCPHGDCGTDGLPQDNVRNQRQEISAEEREKLLDELADLIGHVRNEADLVRISRYLDRLDPAPGGFDVRGSLEAVHRGYPASAALSRGKPDRPKRPAVFRRLAHIAIIAALCCAALMAVVQAAGFDLWGILARWTGADFSFVRPDDPPSDTPGLSSEIQFQSLEDALAAYENTLPLAPTWLPNDAVLNELYVVPELSSFLFYASYTLPSGTMTITLRQVGETPFSTVETNEEGIVKHIAGEIEHHIMMDVAQIKAEWYNQNWECKISGPLTREEIIAMIDSIYE